MFCIDYIRTVALETALARIFWLYVFNYCTVIFLTLGEELTP